MNLNHDQSWVEPIIQLFIEDIWDQTVLPELRSQSPT